MVVKIEVLTPKQMNYLGTAGKDWEELVELLLQMPDVAEVRLVKEEEKW